MLLDLKLQSSSLKVTHCFQSVASTNLEKSQVDLPALRLKTVRIFLKWEVDVETLNTRTGSSLKEHPQGT